MELLFIGAYLVLAVLVFLMFRVLKKSVDKVNEQSKTYYVDKLQEYDELINAREEQLNDLNEEIKNKKVEADSFKKLEHESQIDFDISIIDVLSRTNYKDKNIFELEKMINEKFNYDSEKIIESFIARVDTSKNFEFCKKLRKKFNAKNIYEYKILSEKELEEYLSKKLTKKEYELYTSYKNLHKKTNIEDFIRFLDELVKINNPQIIVYVGSKNENYNHLSKQVKTKLDQTIYRGIKIEYQSKIYDFSINGRNL